MSHILSMFFAVVLSFGHSQTATVHQADAFVPPAAPMAQTALQTVAHMAPQTGVPITHHTLTAHHALYNSYAGTACSSCLTTNATSQPHLIWRAPR